jgi:hypothetical protein
MNWAWVFGMMILAGVPAIVGGGFTWIFFEKWTAVIIWEIILLFVMSVIISRGMKKAAATSSGHH